MKFLSIILCLCWANVAAAFDYPALFDVTRVAQNDVLNVRAEPTPSAELVGTLNPNAKNIEVIRTTEDGKWGLVNIGEGTGWASLRYLMRKSDGTPLSMQCYGTEPFWNVSLNEKEFTFQALGDTDFYGKIDAITKSTNRTDRLGFVGTALSTKLVATLSAGYCSDGMSDREFGLSIELMTNESGTWTQRSGCCSLQP